MFLIFVWVGKIFFNFFYGILLSTFEEQRQFKWSLETKGIAENSLVKGNKDSKSWTFNKNAWQGVGEERWRSLVGGTEKSVYKLFVKSELTKNEKDIKGDVRVKGALGLIKVSWEKGGCWGITDACKGRKVEVQKTDKVWLIIAKGESSIYLIPAVRASNWEGWVDDNWWNKRKEDIEKNGVSDLASWSSKFDQREGEGICWKKDTEEAGITGFTVKRTVDAVAHGKGVIKNEGESSQREIKERFKDNWGWLFGESNDGIEGYMYRNAGTLEFNKGGGNERFGCGKREKYFPLDMAILGDASKLKDYSNSFKNWNQELRVEDNITQIIEI